MQTLQETAWQETARRARTAAPMPDAPPSSFGEPPAPPPAPPGWRDQFLAKTVSGIVRHKVFSALLVLVCIGGSIANTLRQDPYYIATATIFPSASANPMSALGFGGLASLVGNLGSMPGSTSEFPIYENVVQSDRLITPLLDTKVPNTTLLEHLQIEEPNPDLRRNLGIAAVRDNLSYDTDKKTGLVIIGYQDRDPKVAAIVVNRVLELLNDFDVSTSADQAKDRREFVDARLEDAKKELQRAEERVENFDQGNLRIGRAPDLLLEQARLEREVSIEQEVYLALRKEAEMARIDEQRTTPVVNVLDHATAPLQPAGPSLVRNTALGGIAGCVLVVFVFALKALSPRRLLASLSRAGSAA